MTIDFNRYKAFLFDMDGTLVDSMGLWKEIDLEYLARFNIKLPDDLQKCIEGMSFRDTAIYFKERFNISQSVDEMMDTWNAMAFNKYKHEVLLKPGVSEFLKKCKDKGIKMAVATSNSKLLADTCLKALKIYDYFSVILTSADSLKSKPDPEIYLTAAQRLKVLPGECLVFEDITHGILAGINAGMKVVAVDDLYSAASIEEKKKLADFYLYSYEDIMEA